MDHITFDVPKIVNAVRKIKNKNKLSCGPDGYPVQLLTALIPVLASPLSMMYNSFMSTGKLPTVWKNATVIPFFKKVHHLIQPIIDRFHKQASFVN